MSDTQIQTAVAGSLASDERDGADSFRPAILCLPDRFGQLDRDWLGSLQRAFPESTCLARPALARRFDLQALDCASASPSDVVSAVAGSWPKDGLLVVRSGLVLPSFFRERLRQISVCSHAPLLTAFPGNYAAEVNPFAGQDPGGDPSRLDSLIHATADRCWTAMGELPQDCYFLAPVDPGSASRRLDRPGERALIDDTFVLDPERPVGHGQRLSPAARAVFGPSSLAVAGLLADESAVLPHYGLDGRAVTLHVSHSWGGGVARWIDDVRTTDSAGNHLVMVSAGRSNGMEHGQVLRLYADGPERGLLREFVLTPAIADTVSGHAQYRAIVDWLVERFGIGRIILSSLIGHSLDCLRTGLPTLEVLHDFYPATPLLDIDPLRYLDSAGRFRMQQALNEQGASLKFASDSAAHWQNLRASWLEVIERHGVRLLAPSRHVATRWSSLFGGRLEGIEVQGHGFSAPWGRVDPIRPRRRADGRLTLVVVGRQSVGKGLGLLEQALDSVRRYAQIVLVGAGKSAESVFGRSGVDIILDYDRARLPELLAAIGPHAALFLSTVPETWNYVINETRSLGLAPVATRIGSFPERIRHGVDGLLFEPTPQALVATIAELAADPSVLAAMVAAAAAEPTMEEVVARYRQLCPELTRSSRPGPLPDALMATRAARLYDSAEERQRNRQLTVRAEQLQSEVERRTDWAQRQQRLAEERVRWAQSMERDVDAARERIDGLQQELDERTIWAREQQELAEERTAWAQSMERDVDATREQVHGLQQELDERTAWAGEQQELAEERTAWAQSMERDLGVARERIDGLQQELDERTEWAQSLGREVDAAHERNDGLQQELDERTEWAQSLERELDTAREQVDGLQQELDERTEWAQSLGREVDAAHERNDGLQQELDERTEWAQSLERELDTAREQVDGLQQELDERTEWAQSLRREVDAAHERNDGLQQELDERTEWGRSLDRELADRVADLDRSRRELERLRLLNGHQAADLDRVSAERAALEHHLAVVTYSKSWRYTRPIRFVARAARKFLAHQGWNPMRWPRIGSEMVRSVRAEGLGGALARLHQQPLLRAETQASLADVESDPQSPESVSSRVAPPLDHEQAVQFDDASQPVVSIVIPVYNKVELTAACLRSVAAAHVDLPFEVIVVDDCSSDGTEAWLRGADGLTYLRNAVNSGFIDSCNRGAEHARGEFLVFLNNDTTVADGWLDALVEPFHRDGDVGVVGARLVYPDGRLQEAGGIVFNDASGWNYGREQAADRPQYNFVSEADYVSGACLTIRRADFENLGGFDTRFRPAYYEDTDLCFQVRAMGKKVLVQPAATVVHHEGATSGTDESGGIKRYQVVNRVKFGDKWADVLATHPAPTPDFEREDPVRLIRYRRQRRRMLLLDAVTPQADHDSGSVRIVAMMTLLREMGYLVSFMPENRLWVDGYSAELQQAGIEVLCAPPVPLLDAWLVEYGRDLDLVVVSRHYILTPVIELIRKHCPNACLVFDTVDLHFLREQREAELTGRSDIAEQADETRQQELALIRQADVTLVVSPVEQALLGDLEPAADVRIVSNIHTVHGCRNGWEERSGLMFVGGFQHVPNVDAALWLVEAIFPLIRERIPDVVLHLIGSRMPSEIRGIDQPGVNVHGFVRDLEPFLDGCRVSVAPLRYGAGVKGKVNQAMSHGLPVVATACAAEGMFLEPGQDVLVADRADEFADQVVRAHQDRKLWQRLSAGGLINVDKHFSRAAARRALEGIDALIDKRRLRARAG